jgi:hypothetical protein
MFHSWLVLAAIGILMMTADVKAEETKLSVNAEEEAVIESLDILEMLEILEEDDPEMLDILDDLQIMNSQEES